MRDQKGNKFPETDRNDIPALGNVGPSLLRRHMKFPWGGVRLLPDCQYFTGKIQA